MESAGAGAGADAVHALTVTHAHTQTRTHAHMTHADTHAHAHARTHTHTVPLLRIFWSSWNLKDLNISRLWRAGDDLASTYFKGEGRAETCRLWALGD